MSTYHNPIYEGFADWAIKGAKLNMNGWAAHIGRLPAIAAYEDDDVQDAILEFLENLEDRATAAESQIPAMQRQLGVIGSWR